MVSIIPARFKFSNRKLLSTFRRASLLLTVTFFTVGAVRAQYSFYNKPAWEKWIGFGGNHFFGDVGGKQLNGTTLGGYDEIDLKNIKPTFSVGVRYNAKQWLAFRGGLTYARFEQSDANAFSTSQQARNLSFQSNLWELGAVAEFKVASFSIKTKRRKSFWEYYVFGGVGAFYYNPKTEYEGRLVALRELSTEGQGIKSGTKKYSVLAGSVPIGGGLRLGIGPSKSVYVELAYRATTTDYIDDVSGTYYSYEKIFAQKGKVAADLSYRGDAATYPAGRTRGNPTNKDSYLLVNVGFSMALRPAHYSGGRRK